MKTALKIASRTIKRRLDAGETWEEVVRDYPRLTDAELDNFYRAVAPMLDGAKRKKLDQIVKKLKKM